LCYQNGVHWLPIHLTATILSGSLPVIADTSLHDQSITQLEQRLESIDIELEQLARHSLRSGVGAIGYRSRNYDHAKGAAWVGVEFGETVRLDELVLVPAIWRDAEKGFRSDGFPEAFRVLAGTAANHAGSVVAIVKSTDTDLPRIAPLVIPTPGVTASWIRIETMRLTPRAFDGEYIFQLSEIFAFSDEENVALRKPITTSANKVDGAEGWDLQFLTDGFVPYLMNSAQGLQSTAYLSPVDVGRRPSLTIDLEQTQTLSRLHLHTVDQDDTVPQSSPDSIGIPDHFLVEGATEPDFSDARKLLDVRRRTIYDLSPIMMWNLPEETRCRFVRLTALKPYIYTKGYIKGSRIGFAELEVFSEGQNVALGKPVTTSFDKVDAMRPVSKVTDGRNLYGVILSTREWLHQLARRHDLEAERPLIASELQNRYTSQIIILRRMIGIAILFSFSIGFGFLIDRILRMRQLARIKERFAADLHDELGANLHTIGLLSDLAEGAKDSPKELSMLHQRIRAVTERTGTAMRNCTDMLEAKGLYTGLRSDMQRASQRIMADLEYDIVIEGEEHLARLKPRTRVDLFLFYKESLINVSRHSGATELSTRMVARPKEIQLTIRDNGRGLSKGTPSSLRRRARLLGAKLDVSTPTEGGTCITLTLKTRRSRGRKSDHGQSFRSSFKNSQYTQSS